MRCERYYQLVEFILAAIGLIASAPLLLVAGTFIKATTGGPIFFTQERLGKDFKPFRIYKLRTMAVQFSRSSSSITTNRDPRITSVGRILRKFKIDELPQFINVLKGEMSIVGPRPELPCFINCRRKDFERILVVRPGLTDFASIVFMDESSQISEWDDPEKFYIHSILPKKIKLAKFYIRHKNLLLDIKIILATIGNLLLFFLKGFFR